MRNWPDTLNAIHAARTVLVCDLGGTIPGREVSEAGIAGLTLGTGFQKYKTS
ncbi:MAG: hypothetical protein M3309_07270 [Actinomycetota bacterium]|nr:hypothetical protein [Actinomycetota bacterium]